ncbi:hypothetical protein E2493_00545 [Sphingomonas parva]|uniref:DUF883 family protein n=1 Tax=Sphingomonas parva TaxID=2555898 RepID=A0A4Y8ZZI2_9SPHN|nr:hypothetical protein [Sphingomonas parva]TFI60236.1 hypothetical protein E2493_00545 [Sphingomonas parva]
MPPRENELPEGTDHIINGAMETNGTGSDVGGGSGSGAASTSSGAGDGGGFIAGGGDGTGGTTASDGGTVVEQLRGQAYALRDQAGGRVREFADSGKTRASDALEELSRVFADTADSINDRLGGDYAEYARKASDAVSGFADTLRSKDVDEIYGNVRDAVRKSPGVAIGVAAVVGFALARVVKAGFDDATGGQSGSGGKSGSGSGNGA